MLIIAQAISLEETAKRPMPTWLMKFQIRWAKPCSRNWPQKSMVTIRFSWKPTGRWTISVCGSGCGR